MKAARGRLLLACVGAPALVAALLALIELGYVAAGVDPRRHYFVPAVDDQGRAQLVASADPPVPDTTFRALRFPRRAPPGTTRIVCVGDSTCYGLPFDPPVPFSCWIEARLKELLPARPTEVVNLGSNAFASEDVLDVLRDTDGAGADVLVVYVGHNEFLDRNLLPLLNPLAHAVRRALARSRFGTAVMTAAHRAADLQALTRSIRRGGIRDEPFFTNAQLEAGWRNYRDHLTRIAELGRARGARVVLVHPIADAVDTAPHLSWFAAATPPAQRTEFKRRFDELSRARVALESARRRHEPLDRTQVGALDATLDELARIDPTVVALHYERGRLLQLEDRNEEARREFALALEQDGDPVRATAAIHAVIDDVARATGALAVDARPALDVAAAPDLPGQNGWFVDYVHPDVRGHELLADAILRALARASVIAPGTEWRFGAEPTSQQYLERGGWNPAQVAAAKARDALFLLVKTYYGSERSAEATAEARQVFQFALSLDPRCAPAYLGLGMCATIAADADDAVAEFDRARAIDPHALDQLGSQYRSNVAVKALFDAAGLVVRDGRVEKAGR